jgi:predicted RNA-binding protein with PUA-like domain
MSTYFLAKTEPTVYSIDQFQKDLRTIWDGVRNPQAVAAIRQIREGDRVFIYHSGGVSSIVGLARAVSNARPDPKDPKSAVVDLEYLMHIKPPVSLSEIKASGEFNDWALVRQSRLSTMTVPDKFLEWIRQRYPGARI